MKLWLELAAALALIAGDISFFFLAQPTFVPPPARSDRIWDAPSDVPIAHTWVTFCEGPAEYRTCARR